MLKLHVTDNYGRLIADEMSPALSGEYSWRGRCPFQLVTSWHTGDPPARLKTYNFKFANVTSGNSLMSAASPDDCGGDPNLRMTGVSECHLIGKTR